MKIFQRKPALVQAFLVPKWGEVAEDVPPKWLVDRIQRGELTINGLGGFTMTTNFGQLQCMAGDVVLLTDQDTIEFIKAEHLAEQFDLVNPEDILKAA